MMTNLKEQVLPTLEKEGRREELLEVQELIEKVHYLLRYDVDLIKVVLPQLDINMKVYKDAIINDRVQKDFDKLMGEIKKEQEVEQHNQKVMNELAINLDDLLIEVEDCEDELYE